MLLWGAATSQADLSVTSGASSCYVHSRKPEEGIFRIALAVTQRQPEECVFVDDRPLNLESPRRLGFSVIHYQSPEQLRTDLRNLQVEV